MEEAGTFDIEYFLGPDVSTSLSSFAVTMTGVRDGFASIDFFTPATKVDPAPAYPPFIAVGINGLYFNRFNRQDQMTHKDL
jgi:hypothetical protein